MAEAAHRNKCYLFEESYEKHAILPIERTIVSKRILANQNVSQCRYSNIPTGFNAADAFSKP